MNLRVSHPNGTSTQINKIGNIEFVNSLTRFGFFVVPNFNINFLFVHNLWEDSKCEVVFNEKIAKFRIHSPRDNGD